MAINKKLASYLAERKKTDAYWVESAKLDFAMKLEKQIRLAGLSYASLAQKLGTSAAYISKVFRGDTNMTIESMVKLSRATGARLNIEIINESTVAQCWDTKIIQFPKINRQPQVTADSATITAYDDFPACVSEIESRMVA